MSYATSLLAAYPSSYGTTTLFSDNLVRGSSFDNIYHPPVGFGTTDRLFSDDLTFNQISHNPTTYHPPIYTLSNSTSVFPKNGYENSPVADYRQSHPPNDPYVSLNDIREYSESLVTASNTNTASSVARSLHNNKTSGPLNKFPVQQPHYTHKTNDVNGHLPMKSNWSSTQEKTKGQLNDVKKKQVVKQQQQQQQQQPISNAGRAQPSTGTQKNSSNHKLNDDLTPVQSPKGTLP